MTRRSLIALVTIAAALGGSLSLAPAAARDGALAMLSQLDRGQWEVRFRDGGGSRKLCLRDGTELLQLGHRGPPCNRFLVEDAAQTVTVQYTCRGNGYGRTSIRRETGSLVQIESQGIAGGKPFQFAGEARRTGSC